MLQRECGILYISEDVKVPEYELGYSTPSCHRCLYKNLKHTPSYFSSNYTCNYSIHCLLEQVVMCVKTLWHYRLTVNLLKVYTCLYSFIISTAVTPEDLDTCERKKPYIPGHLYVAFSRKLFVYLLQPFVHPTGSLRVDRPGDEAQHSEIRHLDPVGVG